MTNIDNWAQLITQVASKPDGIFPKLLLKINQCIRCHQKSTEVFDMNIVKKNHMDIFNNYKLLYEQLSIENPIDIIDIMAEVSSLKASDSLLFNMIGVGKWIKLHSGNSSRIFFFDDEKTILSDKSLADFLHRIGDVMSGYRYFTKEPAVYYKFKTLPADDIVEYMKKFGVVALKFSDKTPVSVIDNSIDFSKRVLLDQSIVITLCSNLSHGLSGSFYKENVNENLAKGIANRIELEAFLKDKELLINEHVYKQSQLKMAHIAGSTEKARFEELCKSLIVVPDENNPRFYYLKDVEIICASVAERDHATIITGNNRLCNKMDLYYKEIPYKIFPGVQLVESKYA